MTPSSSSPQLAQLISGRWLWFGLRRFTRTQWEDICIQASAWQVQGLHLKVADGLDRWYSQDDLRAFNESAKQHHLQVVPYHYCYGPLFGTEQIRGEAEISIGLGSLFGAVIPDIEDQYMGRYEEAAYFGQQVRAGFLGLWLPTLYANPLVHPVPLLALNPYMDAWLPQVYFSEWDGNAQDAINYVYPQWQHFEQQAERNGQGHLKPVLPIVSLNNLVASEQIVHFIDLMQHYGYIGFWHYDLYAPYASAIMHAPKPQFSQFPIPTPPVTPIPVPTYHAFNEDDRQLWTLYRSVPLNEQAAIEQSWLRARYQRGWNFGPPLEPEHRITRATRTYIEQQFSAARASYEEENGLLTWWTANGPVRI